MFAKREQFVFELKNQVISGVNRKMLHKYKRTKYVLFGFITLVTWDEYCSTQEEK